MQQWLTAHHVIRNPDEQIEGREAVSEKVSNLIMRHAVQKEHEEAEHEEPDEHAAL